MINWERIRGELAMFIDELRDELAMMGLGWKKRAREMRCEELRDEGWDAKNWNLKVRGERGVN